MNILFRIALLTQLARIRVSALSAVTAGLGYLLSKGTLTHEIIFPIAGVFLMASAASALNQLQEHHLDSKMLRTRNRPLPSGRITRVQALLFVLLLLATGLTVLYIKGGATGAVLGLLAILIYNFIYTPMKLRSPWAAIPGGVVGMLPPAIGWVLAGGALTHPQLIALCIFIYLWQVPHFWLIMLRHTEDFRRAGFPTLADRFNHGQLMRMCASWILSTSTAGLMLPLFLTERSYASLAIFLISALMFISGLSLLRPERNTLSPALTPSLNPAWINAYLLTAIVLLSLESLV